MALIEFLNKRGELMANPEINYRNFSFFMQTTLGEIEDRLSEICRIETSNAETQLEEVQIDTALRALRTKCQANFQKYYPNIKGFSREAHIEGDITVQATQCFDWIPLNPGDNTVTKIYSWDCSQNNKLLFRFNLQRNDQGTYALGLQARTNKEIFSYGANMPPYMEVKRLVISLVSDHIQIVRKKNVHS